MFPVSYNVDDRGDMFYNIANIARQCIPFQKGKHFYFRDKLVFMVNYIVAVRRHTNEKCSSIQVPEVPQTVCASLLENKNRIKHPKCTLHIRIVYHMVDAIDEGDLLYFPILFLLHSLENAAQVLALDFIECTHTTYHMARLRMDYPDCRLWVCRH